MRFSGSLGHILVFAHQDRPAERPSASAPFDRGAADPDTLPTHLLGSQNKCHYEHLLEHEGDKADQEGPSPAKGGPHA